MSLQEQEAGPSLYLNIGAWYKCIYIITFYVPYIFTGKQNKAQKNKT